MKANELIEAFVYFNCFDGSKIIVRVTGFNDGIVYGDSETGSHWCNIGKVEPIPITPEILEKNGFEVQDQGGGRKDVWTGFGIDCEGDIEVEFQKNIPVHLKIDGGFKEEYYTSANIKYVHKLQHALRLCGIEKEIVV